MKKTILTIAAAAIATSAFGQPSLDIANKIGEAVKGTATVDGAIGAGEWDNATSYPIDVFLPADAFVEPANEADLSGSFKAMWDDNGLYVLVVAKDADVPLAEDAFEIYTSPAYTRLYGAYQAPGYDLASDIQGLFKLGASGITASHGLYSYIPNEPMPASVQTALTLTDDGYIAEVFLPWTVILGENSSTGVTFDNGIFYDGPDSAGVGAERNFLGFEIQLQDGDNGTSRETKLAWTGGYEGRIGDNAWADTSVWGTLVLVNGVPPQCEATDVFNSDYYSVLAEDFYYGISTPDILYTGYCPFVYSFETGAWWYVEATGASTEGFFIYDFGAGAWKYVLAGFILDL